MPESVHEFDRLLEFDRVCKRYRGAPRPRDETGNGAGDRSRDITALEDMTFDVRAGEMFGFVGSNGAGKTTAMRIALGVLAADSGEVRWNGAPLTLHTRRRIGYLPEERGLYPRMRVSAHLAYLGELHGMKRARARDAAQEWISRLGLAERRHEEVRQLSLGNQQRVQFAAALIHNPEVLVLDEPFSGLDPVAVDSMSTILREQCAAGVPVLFSSHQLDLVQRLCDRVGIVSEGRMVANGTVDQLRETGRVRLIVHAPHAEPGWAGAVPGASTIAENDGRTVVELAGDADDQDVLRAAMATGPVLEFRRQRPALTELFRDVVAHND